MDPGLEQPRLEVRHPASLPVCGVPRDGILVVSPAAREATIVTAVIIGVVAGVAALVGLVWLLVSVLPSWTGWIIIPVIVVSLIWGEAYALSRSMPDD